jgi:hypothetical protein
MSKKDNLDNMSELVDADIERVDLVGKAANGHRFLLAKSEAGDETAAIFTPDAIRELIKEADETADAEEAVEATVETVEAPVEAEETVEAPAVEETVVDAPVAPVVDALAPVLDEVPAEVASIVIDALVESAVNSVTKADVEELEAEAELVEPEEAYVSDIAEELAEGEVEVTTEFADELVANDEDPEVPGSGAWESIDAATAAKQVMILAEVRNAICMLNDRELTELYAGAEWDTDGIERLEEVICLIDEAIKLTSKFAVGEKAESLGVDPHVLAASVAKSDETDKIDAIAAVAKKLAKKSQKADVETIVTNVALVKAGRSLSAANEKALRDAIANITGVLNSLPAEVEKAEDMSEASQSELIVEALQGNEDALLEIGNRVVSEAVEAIAENIPEVAEEAMDEEATETTDETTEVPEETETEDVNGVDEEELTPVAPEEQGTVVNKSEEDLTAEAAALALKKAEKKALKKAEKKAKAQSKVEKLVKEAVEIETSKYVDVIKELKDHIAYLEAPAPARILSNGALPPAHLMRGQDEGALSNVNNIANVDALKKAALSDNIKEQEAAKNQLSALALEALMNIRNAN